MALFTGALLITVLSGLIFVALIEAVSEGGVVGFVPGLAGGCMKARLCCPGKDHTCGVFETLKGKEEKGGNQRKKCFCDTECLVNKDCCHDYEYYCQPIDCQVDEKWQRWGKCSVSCGMGVRNRTRRVLQYPRNGGKECESTVQYVACEGVECKILRTAAGSHLQRLTEVAQILPTGFARWRSDASYKPRADNRQKSIDRRRLRSSLNGRSKGTGNYCANYQLTEVSRMCNVSTDGQSAVTNSWTNDLVKGGIICVECQPTAARANLRGRCSGDGILDKETRWSAMTVSGCSGKWKMIRLPRDECHCINKQHQQQEDAPYNNGFIFI